MDRRKFLFTAGLGSAALAASSSVPFFAAERQDNLLTDQWQNAFLNRVDGSRFRPKNKIGFGGVALGNGFNENPDIECLQSIEAAWNAGGRCFDTSPWYGLGISKHRMLLFLKNKPREEFTLSTKVGRILKPKENFKMARSLWMGKMNFAYEYDYSAAGARKSVEDSLQRLGVSSLDIVYIHDLSPDNGDLKEKWIELFDIAKNGAMKELTKMREEGLIKAWGLGVNTIEPILKTIDVADPDIFLSACQYNLIKHDDALQKVFPKLQNRDISVMVGSPLCAGFLSGKDRYLYGGNFPEGVKEKLAKLKTVTKNHQVDLRTAALQFCAAPKVVSAVIPGAHTVEQAKENAASFKQKIPNDFWAELKKQQLILPETETPTV